MKKAKAAKTIAKRREWTKADLKELKHHSKARTPVVKIAKLTKRSVGALLTEGIVSRDRLGPSPINLLRATTWAAALRFGDI